MSWTVELLNFLRSTLPRRSVDGDLFNQYRQNDEYDLAGAAELRLHNLESYISSLGRKPHALLVGEAAGWRGCRFSGVPFTSEHQLVRLSIPCAGQQTSKNTTPRKEGTATSFWNAALRFREVILVWNALPFHPHQPGKKLSNRRPKTRELEEHRDILERVVEMLEPVRVIAVGNVADASLARLRAGGKHEKVIHPSHGRARLFRSQLAARLGRR